MLGEFGQERFGEPELLRLSQEVLKNIFPHSSLQGGDLAVAVRDRENKGFLERVSVCMRACVVASTPLCKCIGKGTCPRLTADWKTRTPQVCVLIVLGVRENKCQVGCSQLAVNRPRIRVKLDSFLWASEMV